jgi:predicted O-methyltransferase YrrM
MDELTKLATKYKADKWGKHHYTPVYYEMFKDRRESVKKVLEIGTAEGASMFMWRDFFPKATIYGGEIDKKRVELMQGHDRINVMECNQYEWRDLDRLIDTTGGDIDLFVDDGSHQPKHQVFTCVFLINLLVSGATYIIEDVADISIIEKLSRYNPEVVRVGKRYDDVLLIIRK